MASLLHLSACCLGGLVPKQQAGNTALRQQTLPQLLSTPLTLGRSKNRIPLVVGGGGETPNYPEGKTLCFKN